MPIGLSDYHFDPPAPASEAATDPFFDAPTGVLKQPRVEEHSGPPLILWAVVILIMVAMVYLIASTMRMWKHTDQMDKTLREATSTASTAVAIADKAMKAAEAERADKAQIDQNMALIFQQHHMMMEKVGSQDRRLDAQGRKLGDLEKRISAQSQPMITGTNNAPTVQQSAAVPANSLASILDGMGLQRANRPGSSEQTWLVATADGKTVDVRPWGSTADAVYATNTVTGESYRIDRKSKIAVASRK